MPFLAAFSPKNRCPFQFGPVIALATCERLRKVPPFQAYPSSRIMTRYRRPFHSLASRAPDLSPTPSRVVGPRAAKGRASPNSKPSSTDSRTLKPSKAPALSDRHHQPASGSTPHDRRRASHHATPFRLASSRASEQDDHVLTTSADSLKAPLPYPPLASSPPKKPVVFAPHDNTGRLPPPPPLRRSVRDLQIPIGCPQPNRASPSRGFLLTRLSDAGPAPSPRACKGPASETLFAGGDGGCRRRACPPGGPRTSPWPSRSGVR